MTKDTQYTSEIITKHFNHNFNTFISLSSSKTIGTFQTGGLKEFKSKTYHIFNHLSSELERFRDEFFQTNVQKDQIEIEEIKKRLHPLIEIYKEGASYKKLNKSMRNSLNKNFIQSSKKFFKEIDELYGFTYFTDKISKIQVSQDIIDDYEFARQYFGKATAFGSALGRGEIEKLEKDYLKPELKEKIKEFAKRPYIASPRPEVKESSSIQPYVWHQTPVKTKQKNTHENKNFFGIIIISILIFLFLLNIFILQDNKDKVFEEANEKCAESLAESFCKVKTFEIKGKLFSCYWDENQKTCFAKQ